MEQIKASFHNHSVYSGDKYLRKCTVKRLVDYTLCSGLDMLVITDSNNDYAVDAILEKKNLDETYKIEKLDEKGVLIEKDNKLLYLLRGMEFHNKGGHILSVGHDKRLIYHSEFDDYFACDLVDMIHEKNGLAIAAHPFQESVGGVGRIGLYGIMEQLDAVEVFNAQSIRLLPFILDSRIYNDEAKKFAKDNEIPGIATSDAHGVNQIDDAYVIFPELDCSSGQNIFSSIKKSLKNNNFLNHEEYVSWFEFIKWAILPKLTSPKKVCSLFKIVNKLLFEKNQ